MTPARIQNELGTWLWWVRPSHIVVRHGADIEDVEAIGPTATVDPTPMIEGPWWGEKPWLGTPTRTGHRLRRVFGCAAPQARLDESEEKVLRALLLPRIPAGDVIRETSYGPRHLILREFTLEVAGDIRGVRDDQLSRE